MNYALLSLRLLLLICSGISFIVAYHNDTSPNIQKRALTYMRKKYRKKFSCVALWGNSSNGIEEMLVICNEDQIQAHIHITKTANNRFEFHDTYKPNAKGDA